MPGPACRIGLGSPRAEVARRQAAEGPNRLPEPPPERRLVLLAAQFRNGMVALLAGAAVVASPSVRPPKRR